MSCNGVKFVLSQSIPIIKKQEAILIENEKYKRKKSIEVHCIFDKRHYTEMFTKLKNV